MELTGDHGPLVIAAEFALAALLMAGYLMETNDA
jgi:hypothetical protein